MASEGSIRELGEVKDMGSHMEQPGRARRADGVPRLRRREGECTPRQGCRPDPAKCARSGTLALADPCLCFPRSMQPGVLTTRRYRLERRGGAKRLEERPSPPPQASKSRARLGLYLSLAGTRQVMLAFHSCTPGLCTARLIGLVRTCSLPTRVEERLAAQRAWRCKLDPSSASTSGL